MEEGKHVITVVCTGNSCRSPMAERLLQHALEALDEPWAKNTKVLSAGIAAFPGDSASRNAINALQKAGLDLNSHRSRRLCSELMAITDVLLAMTSAHLDAIDHAFPNHATPAYRFCEWLPDGACDVQDPFGGDLQTYLDTRDQLVASIPTIIAFLRSHLNHDH